MSALLTAVQHDAAALSTGAKEAGNGNFSGAAGTLSTAAANMLSAAQAAQADPPPGCESGLRANFEEALADVVRSADSEQNTITALDDGNYSTATADIDAAGSDFQAGIKPLNAVAKDFRTLDNG